MSSCRAVESAPFSDMTADPCISFDDSAGTAAHRHDWRMRWRCATRSSASSRASRSSEERDGRDHDALHLIAVDVRRAFSEPAGSCSSARPSSSAGSPCGVRAPPRGRLGAARRCRRETRAGGADRLVLHAQTYARTSTRATATSRAASSSTRPASSTSRWRRCSDGAGAADRPAHRSPRDHRPRAAALRRRAGGTAAGFRRWLRDGSPCRPPTRARARARPPARSRACGPTASPISSGTPPPSAVHERSPGGRAARDARDLARANARPGRRRVPAAERPGGPSLPAAELYALPFVPAAVARERERFGAYATRTMGGNLLGDLVQEEVPQARAGRGDRRARACCCPAFAARAPYQLMLAPRTPRARFEDDGAAVRRAARSTPCDRLARRSRSMPRCSCGCAPRPAGPSTSAGGSTSCAGDRPPAGLEAGAGLAVNPSPPRHAAAELREPNDAGARAARLAARRCPSTASSSARSARVCSSSSASPCDGPADADRLADKVRALRVFPDREGRMNEPLGDREVLCISQFTLYGDTRRGNRPSYVAAAPGESPSRSTSASASVSAPGAGCSAPTCRSRS